jgi:hypothetical protein
VQEVQRVRVGAPGPRDRCGSAVGERRGSAGSDAFDRARRRACGGSAAVRPRFAWHVSSASSDGVQLDHREGPWRPGQRFPTTRHGAPWRGGQDRVVHLERRVFSGVQGRLNTRLYSWMTTGVVRGSRGCGRRAITLRNHGLRSPGPPATCNPPRIDFGAPAGLRARLGSCPVGAACPSRRRPSAGRRRVRRRWTR